MEQGVGANAGVVMLERRRWHTLGNLWAIAGILVSVLQRQIFLYVSKMLQLILHTCHFMLSSSFVPKNT